MRKNLPIIFMIGSLALLGLTIYETGKAAIKIDRKLDEKRNQEFSRSGNFEITNRKEVIKECLPEAVPAIISAAATVACIVTGNYISYKQKMDLIGALAAVRGGYKAYSDYIHEASPDMDLEAREIANKRLTEASLKDVSGKMLWFDEWSGRYFEKDTEDVMAAEYHLNRNFILRGYATLNEFYEFLDLPKVHDGDQLGWSDFQEAFYGYRWVDFLHTPKKGKNDYIQISFPFPPVSDYDEVR